MGEHFGGGQCGGKADVNGAKCDVEQQAQEYHCACHVQCDHAGFETGFYDLTAEPAFKANQEDGY